MGRVVAAVDLGASRTRAALYVDREELAYIVSDTPRSPNGAAVTFNVMRMIEELVHRTGLSPSIISIASIGPINYKSGNVENTPNHPAPLIPLRSFIEERLNIPVLLLNDAVAGAWAEYNYRRSHGVRDLVYIAIGTGIGVGAVVSGRLLLGRRGDSHEAGHIVVDLGSSVRCGCGGIGHLEALASGRAHREGIPYSMARRALAAGIASIIACYDPEVIVFGGGFYYSGLIDLKELARLTGSYAFQGRLPRFEEAHYGDKANLYGAYLAAIRPTEEILRLNIW
ncbi:MAG: ROK family protein [Desulfurococcales archaeon]|nr:ROK family protein [Desulfurococcales archaeon]